MSWLTRVNDDIMTDINAIKYCNRLTALLITIMNKQIHQHKQLSKCTECPLQFLLQTMFIVVFQQCGGGSWEPCSSCESEVWVLTQTLACRRPKRYLGDRQARSMPNLSPCSDLFPYQTVVWKPRSQGASCSFEQAAVHPGKQKSGNGKFQAFGESLARWFVRLFGSVIVAKHNNFPSKNGPENIYG